MIKVYFDGASKGNPGHAGSGCYIIDSNSNIIKKQKYVGIATNNVAEYNGLILGLISINDFKDSEIKVYGDSKLVIEQMNGKWKVKSPNLIDLHNTAKNLAKNFKNIEFIHIRRELNGDADILANLAVSERTA